MSVSSTHKSHKYTFHPPQRVYRGSHSPDFPWEHSSFLLVPELSLSLRKRIWCTPPAQPPLLRCWVVAWPLSPLNWTEVKFMNCMKCTELNFFYCSSHLIFYRRTAEMTELNWNLWTMKCMKCTELNSVEWPHSASSSSLIFTVSYITSPALFSCDLRALHDYPFFYPFFYPLCMNTNYSYMISALMCT